MKIIYSCYWGSYLSVVAASLHLGLLKAEQFKEEELIKLPFFDKIKYEQIGELFHMDEDTKGRQIYVMGSKSSGRIIERALNGLAEIYGFGRDTVKFIELNQFNNFYTSFGYFLIHKCKLKQVGFKFVVKGIRKTSHNLVNVVSNVINQPSINK